MSLMSHQQTIRFKKSVRTHGSPTALDLLKYI